MWTQETCFAQRVQFRQSMHFIYLCPNHWLDLCVDWILREENRADVLTHSAAMSRFVAGKDCALGFGGGGREVGNLLPHPLAVAIRGFSLQFLMCCLRDPSRMPRPSTTTASSLQDTSGRATREAGKGYRLAPFLGPCLNAFFFCSCDTRGRIGSTWGQDQDCRIHSKSRVENDVCGVIFCLDMCDVLLATSCDGQQLKANVFNGPGKPVCTLCRPPSTCLNSVNFVCDSVDSERIQSKANKSTDCLDTKTPIIPTDICEPP